MSITGRTNKSGSFDEGEGEDLDPRIKSELEQLNAATDGINHLETELSEAQGVFNSMMNDAAVQLKSSHQNLGKCVDKSRPYYEALKNAKSARTQLHEASLRYELVQMKHFNAKKRAVDVEKKANEAIDGRLDPTLQESMNQVTTEVMETSIAYEEVGKKHHIINEDFNKKHIELQQVYDKLKTQVGKSRPFFELKSNLNRKLEIQKQRVQKIQEGIQLSKQAYSETLGKLQKISDDIHRTRQVKKQSVISEVSETTVDESQHSNMEMTRNVSLDDTSIDDDSKSMDSQGSSDNAIWEPGLTEEDTHSTSSKEIEYNLLKSNASMDNTQLNDIHEAAEGEPNVPKKRSLDNSNNISNENGDGTQSEQSNDRSGLSDILFEVNDAMKGMQEGLTSPYACITSHELEYSMSSAFCRDIIDGRKRGDIASQNKSHSFTDLVKASISTFSMSNLIESRDRCNSLPNILGMECQNIAKGV